MLPPPCLRQWRWQYDILRQERRNVFVSGRYKCVRTLYNLVVKVVCLKAASLTWGYRGTSPELGVQCTPCPHSSDDTVPRFVCLGWLPNWSTNQQDYCFFVKYDVLVILPLYMTFVMYRNILGSLIVNCSRLYKARPIACLTYFHLRRTSVVCVLEDTITTRVIVNENVLFALRLLLGDLRQ